MMGVLLIERENSMGDRRTVDQIDGEESHAYDRAKERARSVLQRPAVFAVRVIRDRGDALKTVYYIDVTGRERDRP